MAVASMSGSDFMKYTGDYFPDSVFCGNGDFPADNTGDDQ